MECNDAPVAGRAISALGPGAKPAHHPRTPFVTRFLCDVSNLFAELAIMNQSQWAGGALSLTTPLVGGVSRISPRYCAFVAAIQELTQHSSALVIMGCIARPVSGSRS